MTALALVPRSDAWHADRATGIGSSDAPIITGDAPASWGDPIELLQRLYAEKTGLLDGRDRPDNALMEWGRRLEDVVAAWYAEQPNGHPVQKVNRRDRHREHEWMTASIDRLTRGVRPRRIVEVKTAPFGGDEWGAPGTAEIPIHVLIQVQHQLAVTGLTVADVAVLFHGSDPRIYTVERDEALIADLIELESEFVACVREGRAPDYSGLLDKGKRVRPPVDGEVVADPALDRLITSVYEATETRKAAEAAEKALKARLTEAIDPYAVVHGSEVDVIYRPNRPSRRVGWEYVAKAYRKAIERFMGDPAGYEWPPSVDLDAIESTFTVEQAGARPIRFTERKEGTE